MTDKMDDQAVREWAAAWLAKVDAAAPMLVNSNIDPVSFIFDLWAGDLPWCQNHGYQVTAAIETNPDYGTICTRFKNLTGAEVENKPYDDCNNPLELKEYQEHRKIIESYIKSQGPDFWA